MSMLGMMSGGSPPFFTNGDFELGDVSGWDQSDMQVGDTIAASQTHVHGGSYAMQMDCSSLEGPFQSHTKDAGTYSLTFWIWAAAGVFLIKIGPTTTYTLATAEGDYTYTPNTWTKITVESIVHAGGALKLKIADGAGSTQCWLDDFVLS